jgi:drug/metabolite transporter (DMT)-like permease
MTSAAKARLQLAGAALLFSTGGAGIKLSTLSGWQVAGFRSAVAALFFLVFLPVAWHRESWRAVPVAGAYATTMLLFVVANKLTTAANTIFLQSTAPLYVLLLSPWLLREAVRPRDALFMAVLGVGLAMVLVGATPAADTAPEPLSGNIIAAWGGVAWALTIMGFRWIGRSPLADLVPTTLVLGNLLAFAIALPRALPVTGTMPADWIIILYLGIFQIGASYLLLSSGIRHIGALEVSLLLLLEPALNPLWAWLVHGEAPGAWPLAGGALILLATTMRGAVDARAS